jgi:hypothetical protein
MCSVLPDLNPHLQGELFGLAWLLREILIAAEARSALPVTWLVPCVMSLPVYPFHVTWTPI